MTTLQNTLQAHRPSWPAVLLFTALLAQAPHAAAVFIRIAPHGAPWEVATSFVGAWVYAIALEGATAYFVWRNKLSWDIAFAVFSVAHNLAYYMPSAWTVDVFGATLEVRYIFSALLISASLPIAIAAFSHVQAKSATESPTMDNLARADIQTPVARPVGTLGPANDVATVTPPSETAVLAPSTELRTIAAQSDTDIAALLGVKRQAVQGWRKRNTLEQNIAKNLPVIAAPATNGYNHAD